MVARRQVHVSQNRHSILWILVLAAVLRFVQIDAPPLGRHAWRQSDTASVARNFHRHGNHLLYPQIDWEMPGFVEMEFPIYPWTTSLVYGIVGESDAVARALAVAGSLVTIGFLYLLFLRILGRRAALWAAFLFAVLPASLFFGRAIMPESWMLAASAAAVYFFLRWTEEDSWFFCLLALLATALACLLKLTALYLGLPLLWLAWQRWGRKTFTRWQFWLFGGMVALALLAWYGHAYRLGQEFGASFHILTAAGTDKWGSLGLLLDPSFYHRVFIGYPGERLLTWLGLPIFVLGIFLRRRSTREHLLDVWLLAVVVVLLLASGGSYQHDYYSLPLILPAVGFMAKVFDRGWASRKPWLVGAVLLILILSAYRHLGALADEREEGTDRTIARVMAAETAPGELVISCNGANPVWLYVSDRRGWGRDCGQLDKAELEKLIDRGARTLLARGSLGASSPNQERLSAYLHSFFEVPRNNETVFVSRLTPRRPDDELSWQTIMREDFADSPVLKKWVFSEGSWRLDSGSLVGAPTQRTAEARTLETLPACHVCQARISLSLSRPPTLGLSTETSEGSRGSDRSRSKASIDLWWQEEGTGVTLHFARRAGRMILRQTEKGTRLSSRAVDVPLVASHPLDLELRSDGFELELRVNGESVLTTTNRLPSPLVGRLAIRTRRGPIRLDHFEIQVPTSLPPALRPPPQR